MNHTSDKPHTFEQTSMTFLMGFAENECQILQKVCKSCWFWPKLIW